MEIGFHWRLSPSVVCLFQVGSYLYQDKKIFQYSVGFAAPCVGNLFHRNVERNE